MSNPYDPLNEVEDGQIFDDYYYDEDDIPYQFDDEEPFDNYTGCTFDAEALASAGHGMDEDYGYYGGDDYW
jgi:hypothetical protein